MQSRYELFLMGEINRCIIRQRLIWVLGMIFFAGSLWFALDWVPNDLAFGFVVTFLFLASLLLANQYNLGIMPTVRLLLLAGPGLIGGWAAWLSDGKMQISFFTVFYTPYLITPELIREYAAASVVAGFVSTVGFILSLQGVRQPVPVPKSRWWAHSVWGVLGWVCLVIAGFCFWQQSVANQSMLDTGVYAVSTGKLAALNLGMFNTASAYFLFLSLVGLYYHHNHTKRPRLVWLLVVVYFLYILLIRGERQNPLGIAICLGLFYWFCYVKYPRRMVLYSICIVLFGWVMAINSSLLRTSFTLPTFYSLVSKPFSHFVTEVNGFYFLDLDTASSVSGTFYAVYEKTEGGRENFLLGSSYLDFLGRTPPQFLYPDRPLDLSGQMKVDGQWLALGGIIEQAEAYWNFGRLGVIIVPFCISWAVGWFSRWACNHPNPLIKACPVTLLAVMPRWIWYQTFVGYKAIVIISVLGSLFAFLSEIMVNAAKPDLLKARSHS